MSKDAGSYDNELPFRIKEAYMECVLCYRKECMGLLTVNEFWQYAGMEGNREESDG